MTQKRWSTEDLAHALKFEYDRFRKIVNMSKPTKKRDVIISICVVLQMSVDDTNKALNLYDNMPALDSTIIRDDVFIQILKNNQTALFEPDNNGIIDYVDNIDKLLIAHGCSKLDLHKQNFFQTKKSAKYKPIKQNVSIVSDGVFWREEYSSLSTMYQPSAYLCKGSILLENTENKQRIIATVSLSINMYTYWIERKADGRAEKYDLHSDEQDLIPFFKEIHLAARNELNNLLRILNDTRNYKLRKSARYIDGSIHFYLESFNYDIPEFNEYCFLEVSGNKVTLNVYDHSEFMHYHLGSEEYNRVFGEREHYPVETFTSIEDLSEKASTMPNETDRIRYSIWKRIFIELMSEAQKLRDDVENQRACIQDIGELDDSGTSVVEYYKVIQEYACTRDNDGTLVPNKDYASFTCEGLPETTLSVDELRQAYKLGIPDIKSVCDAKRTLGSLCNPNY